jgi:hypothetical protein
LPSINFDQKYQQLFQRKKKDYSVLLYLLKGGKYFTKIIAMADVYE